MKLLESLFFIAVVGGGLITFIATLYETVFKGKRQLKQQARKHAIHIAHK